MLTYIPVGVDIPRQSLVNGAMCNDDGHGWAIANSKELVVGKNMNYTKALDEFMERREQMPGSAALFHSRWATHGAVNEFNTHPFHVSDTAVMAHNGVMPSQFQPQKGDPRSDTRIFADLVRQQFTNNPNRMPSRRNARVISTLIGSGNKLVFLATSPSGPKVRIVNEQAGQSVGGVWYSNSDFRGNSWKMPGSYYGGSFDWEAWKKKYPNGYSSYSASKAVEPYNPPSFAPADICPNDLCGSYYVDTRDRICKVCHTCLDCGTSVLSECVCWIPPAKDVPWFMEDEEVDATNELSL